MGLLQEVMTRLDRVQTNRKPYTLGSPVRRCATKDTVGRHARSRRRGSMGTGGQTTKSPVDLGGDALQLERQVCFALVVASRSVRAVYRSLLESLGLTRLQYL